MADPDPLDALGFIEGTNNMADAMDALKKALEERGWSTAVSEQVGAQFGVVLMSFITPPPPEEKGRKR